MSRLARAALSRSLAGWQYVQIDLGASYSADKIVVWHDYPDGRTYHNTKTQVSTNGVAWTTVFDSAAVSGEYPETAAGHTVAFITRDVRYVRETVNDSTANDGDHWAEIQVWGRATVAYVGNYIQILVGLCAQIKTTHHPFEVVWVFNPYPSARMTSIPPIQGRRTSGTTTEPSACW